MANPSTATPTPATTLVEDTVRFAAESSRRSLIMFNQFNRDLFTLWSTAAQLGLQTAVDVQKTAIANTQAFLERLPTEA